MSFRGSFAPTGALAGRTRAAHLVSELSDVLFRFSNGAGDLDTPDNRPGIRGMAVHFLAEGRPVHDLVAANIPAFASRTPEGFVELAEIVGRIDPRASRIGRLVRAPLTAARFLRFAIAHPESRRALAAFGKLRPPASFATTRYNGVHAYVLVNDEGLRTPFRFRLEPAEREASLTKPEASGREPGFLVPELQARLATGPVRFALVVQLAEPGDPTGDPTKAWPDDRRTVVAGHLEVTSAAGHEGEADVFDPTLVPDGVELSDDPVLRFRGPVYRLSARRRAAAGS